MPLSKAFGLCCLALQFFAQLVFATYPCKYFDFTLTQKYHAPDGYSREMLLVNSQSPGPIIEVDHDDWVVINVYNQSPYNTSIHFHGIEMSGTPWSDGVPGVTQHPIHPGASFTYQFKATQYGSYWYHSHFEGQIEDGLYGAIIIHPSRDSVNLFHMISNDPRAVHILQEAERDVKPLLISDYTHITSEAKWNMTVAAGLEMACYDSLLFNGKGSVQCLGHHQLTSYLSAEQKAYMRTVPGATLTDKGCLPPSVLIKFGGGSGNESAVPPGTFSGCHNTEGHVEVISTPRPSSSREHWIALDIIGGLNFITGVVSIDEHDMWVYAMDGSYIEPQKVQAIQVTNGDRYSVFIQLNRTGDFKIRCSSATFAQLMIGYAILSVGGQSKRGDPLSTPYIDIAGNPLSKNVTFFDQKTAYPFPPEPVPKGANDFFALNMKVDGSSYLWALNSTRLMPADVESREPVLFHPNPYIHNNVTISTKLGDWIDLLLFTGNIPMPPHPIHKHGTKMYLLGTGIGPFRWNSTEEAIKDIPGELNVVNPPRRDGFATPFAFGKASWMLVRYQATNPGAWLLHCHIDNHLQGGMMMILQDGVDHWPKVPDEYLDNVYHTVEAGRQSYN